MATWEDGPEYAPAQRPDDFAGAQAAPLETVAAQDTLRRDAPDALPVFQPAEQPGPPLASLSPQQTDRRDPTRPFEVVESTATADTSAWSGAHSSSGTPQPPAGGWAPPTTAPAGPGPAGLLPAAADAPPVALRDASSPFSLSGHQPAPPPGPYPAPGTVQWFAPPAPGEVPAGAPAPSLSIPQRLTWGYIIVLALSLFWFIAPATLVIGVILSLQVRADQLVMRKLRGGALIALGVIVVLSIALGPVSFSDWWSTVSVWAMLISLALLLASYLVVLRERARGGYPPPGSNWG